MTPAPGSLPPPPPVPVTAEAEAEAETLPPVQDPFAPREGVREKRIPPGPRVESNLPDPFVSKRGPGVAAPKPAPEAAKVARTPEPKPTPKATRWSRGLQDPFAPRGLERRDHPAPAHATTGPLRNPWK